MSELAATLRISRASEKEDPKTPYNEFDEDVNEDDWKQIQEQSETQSVFNLIQQEHIAKNNMQINQQLN